MSLAEDDMILRYRSAGPPRTSPPFTAAAPAPFCGTARWGSSNSTSSVAVPRRCSLAIADSDAFSLAGGGDTLAAIDKYGIADKVSYISTGGGAFLEYVEGKELPAVAVLKERWKA